MKQKQRYLLESFLKFINLKKGEFGADRIYAGQMAVLGKTSVGPTIKVAKIIFHILNVTRFYLKKFPSICGIKKKAT